MVMRPRSVRTSPLSILRSVLLPAPLCPIKPMHSPGLNSKETSSTAKNSAWRSCKSSLPLRAVSSAARSVRPYQSEYRRRRQNFFETCSTSTTGISAMLGTHSLDQDRQGEAKQQPPGEERKNSQAANGEETD